MAMIRPDEMDDKEGILLSRLMRYCPADGQGEERMEIEVGTRHSKRIIHDLGLHDAKAFDTPAVKRSAAEVEKVRPEAIVSKLQQMAYTSNAMTAAYLPLERPDLGDAVK